MALYLIMWGLLALLTPRRKRRPAPVAVEPQAGREALTVNETAWVLNVAPNTVWALLARGDLPSFKVGRKRLIARRAAEEFMAHGGTTRPSVRKSATA